MGFNLAQVPSPNFWQGRGNQSPIGIVVHIMAGTLAGTAAWFRNEASQVSAHYGVGKTGTIYQFVQEKDTAWANGTIHHPSWKLLKDIDVNPNCYTISIENEGFDLSNAPEAQKEALAELIFEICNRWNIPYDRDHIVGHYEIDSIRKPDCPAVDKKVLNEIVTMVQIKGRQS